MQRTLLTLTALGLIFSATVAEAGIYARVNAGAGKYSGLGNAKGLPAYSSRDKDDYYSYIGAEAGYTMSIPMLFSVKAGLDYTYRLPFEQKYTVVGGTVKDEYTLHTLMAKGTVDLNVIPFISPYATAGAGYTWIDIDRSTTGTATAGKVGSETEFTWMAGFGVNFNILGIVGANIGYRYTKMGDIMKAQEITIGGGVSF